MEISNETVAKLRPKTATVVAMGVGETDVSLKDQCNALVDVLVLLL